LLSFDSSLNFCFGSISPQMSLLNLLYWESSEPRLHCLDSLGWD
jgi:hypothetical protein